MTIEQIVKKRDYFKEITWRYLSNCLRSFEEHEYLSAAIWSAVFVESILKDYLREFGEKNKERDELDSLVKRVANHIRNERITRTKEKHSFSLLLFLSFQNLY